jgi:hypothetical protein
VASSDATQSSQEKEENEEMVKCPNCGSTAQVRKWIDSIEKPDTHSFYFCGCGECFVAEDPHKQKENFCRQERAKK